MMDLRSLDDGPQRSLDDGSPSKITCDATVGKLWYIYLICNDMVDIVCFISHIFREQPFDF